MRYNGCLIPRFAAEKGHFCYRESNAVKMKKRTGFSLNAKTKKLLLGAGLLLLAAIVFFFFPELITSTEGDISDVPNDLSSSVESHAQTSSLTGSTHRAADTSGELHETPTTPDTTKVPETDQKLDEHGSYTHRDDVALYIYQYGKLPSNFITKSEAKKLGWSSGGLDKYAPGKCIGGDRFGNYEGILPKRSGRTYTECDIDTMGASSRGAKRIVFSNDGLIYYTEDHYNTFTLLYGEP